MFDSDLEEEYTIMDIEKVYERFRWGSEYLSIAISLLKKVSALDGLRLWIKFGYIVDKKKDVIAALGFNDYYLVAFDIGDNEPRSLSIGSRENDPVTIEVEGIVKGKAVEYTFGLLFNDCELYKLVADNDNLEATLPQLADRIIKECSVIRKSQVC